MARDLMPKSGIMMPHVVVTRDAAVVGVSTVDGFAGAIDLTDKYLQKTDASATYQTKAEGASKTYVLDSIQPIMEGALFKADPFVDNNIPFRSAGANGVESVDMIKVTPENSIKLGSYESSVQGVEIHSAGRVVVVDKNDAGVETKYPVYSKRFRPEIEDLPFAAIGSYVKDSKGRTIGVNRTGINSDIKQFTQKVTFQQPVTIADGVGDYDAVTKAWVERNSVTPSYDKVGSFAEGGTATANTSALLYNNMYYSPISGTLTVPPSSSPDGDWVCVGYLSAYSVDDPRNYGAKPNIATYDSSDALALWRDSIITRKRKTAYPTGREDPNMFNLGGAVFDMSQGAYYISRSFTIDNCLNFTVMNPSLIAIGSFPDTDAVLDFRKLSGTRPIENIVVFNPNIDANWKAASSIRITGDFLKVTVWGGLLTRYLQHGVKMQPNGSSPHELNMGKTHIFQQPDWRDPFPSHVTEGVGLDIDCYDNNFSDIIIGSQYKDVMILRKGANAFSNCHFYPDQDTDSTKGRVVIMSNADQFSNCYFDGCLIESNSDGARFTINACNWLVPPHGVAINLISNPYQVKVTQCRFRNTTGTTMNDSVIKMKTLAEGRVSRPDIRNNYTENCTAISTSGSEYFTLTSTESARVVTRDIPDQFQPATSVIIQEHAVNTNDDTWLLKARLISTSQVRMRPYNMNVGWSTTATYTGPVILTYNIENDYQ